MKDLFIFRKVFSVCILLVLYGSILPVSLHAKSIRMSDDFTDYSVNVVDTVILPKWYHEGLLLDHDKMWVANGKSGKIWVIDLLTKKVSAEIMPPSTFTESVVKAPGGRYYITDWDDEKLYEADLLDGKMVVRRSLSLAPAHPAGAVVAGKRIFLIVWTRGMGTKFELVEVDESFTIIDRYTVRRIQEPSQLAWDGTALWVSSWFDQHVYRLDIAAWQITGSFRAPVPLVTGLAWDGKYMWLTGTNSDLYKLELTEKAWQAKKSK